MILSMLGYQLQWKMNEMKWGLYFNSHVTSATLFINALFQIANLLWFVTACYVIMAIYIM